METTRTRAGRNDMTEDPEDYSPEQIDAVREAGRAVVAFIVGRTFHQASIGGDILREIVGQQSDEWFFDDLLIMCAGAASEEKLTKVRHVPGSEDEKTYSEAFRRVIETDATITREAFNRDLREARNHVSRPDTWRVVEATAAKLLQGETVPFAKVVEFCEHAKVERDPLPKPNPQG
jgi:hypothetical protein